MVPVEVLNPKAIKAPIGLELFSIEAMADHTRIGDLLGQVADPAGHQIEQLGALGEPLAVKVRETGAETAIKMLHKPGDGIKEGVIGPIEFASIRPTENLNHHVGVPDWGHPG